MLDRTQDVFVSDRRMAEFEEFLARLQRQRDAAQAAHERLDKAIKLLLEFQKVMPPEELMRYAEGFPAGAVDFEAPPRSKGILPPQDIAAAVRVTLLDAGRPMKRGALVRELEKRQIPLAGKDRNKNLGTILWRHKNQFVSLEKLGYWVRDVPIPGVYEPSH